MRTVAEHRAAVLGLVRPLGTERVPVGAALGRVLAEFGYANEQYREPEKN
ncbi:MAG: hypothetical protein IE926_08345 [Micrococcales bacterium]|nr:hypothetical protein [Micrococcales bacterium]